MTFSIVGRCAETGQLGIALSSSSISSMPGAAGPHGLANVARISSSTSSGKLLFVKRTPARAARGNRRGGAVEGEPFEGWPFSFVSSRRCEAVVGEPF